MAKKLSINLKSPILFFYEFIAKLTVRNSFTFHCSLTTVLAASSQLVTIFKSKRYASRDSWRQSKTRRLFGRKCGIRL